MNKLKYNLLLILALSFSLTLHASEPMFTKEFTREVHETFDVTPGVKFGVQNKYGDINITTWNKNQIQIDVLIKVKSSNSEKAQKFLNEIKIDFEASSSKVRAKTVYPDKENSSWWSNWFGNNKNLDYEVHYTINAPADMNTTLINKYGNISQTSIEGNCDVTNKYGDVFFEEVSGSLSLNLGYGKAKIEKAGDSKMEIKYSSLKMGEIGNLEISTKYSNINITQCNNVTSHSKYDDFVIESAGMLKNSGKYDDFKIGTIDAIDIDTKYTDVDIDKLNQKGRFDTGYGSVHVKSTGSGLEVLSIQSKYTGYKFGGLGDFHLEFVGAHSSLHISDPYEKYNSNRDGSDLQVKAYRGSKSGGASITAKMKYGGLKIY